MSQGELAMQARLAVRGRLQYKRADGSVIKEVEILDGSSLPFVAPPPVAEPEPPHADHP